MQLLPEATKLSLVLLQNASIGPSNCTSAGPSTCTSTSTSTSTGASTNTSTSTSTSGTVHAEQTVPVAKQSSFLN